MARRSAYDPLLPARRPGGKPQEAPSYRVLVHKRFSHHYGELVPRVGLQQASQFWDHVANTPGSPSPVASTCYLRGRAGRPQAAGWSRTIHYELTGSARVDYQYNDAYTTGADDEPHRVVAILTISYSSH
jgi:hypothetical protein